MRVFVLFSIAFRIYLGLSCATGYAQEIRASSYFGQISQKARFQHQVLKSGPVGEEWTALRQRVESVLKKGTPLGDCSVLFPFHLDSVRSISSQNPCGPFAAIFSALGIQKILYQDVPEPHFYNGQIVLHLSQSESDIEATFVNYLEVYSSYEKLSLKLMIETMRSVNCDVSLELKSCLNSLKALQKAREEFKKKYDRSPVLSKGVYFYDDRRGLQKNLDVSVPVGSTSDYKKLMDLLN